MQIFYAHGAARKAAENVSHSFSVFPNRMQLGEHQLLKVTASSK